MAKASSFVGGVTCVQPIVVRFELLFSELLPYDASADLMKHINGTLLLLLHLLCYVSLDMLGFDSLKLVSSAVCKL